MTKPVLDRSLESIIGRENINESSSLLIDEIRPRMIIKPGSPKEAAECLKVCAEMNAAVVPAGFATWLECGNPRKRADVVMSLERINRIIDYSAPDLTAIVEAGIALNDFNEVVTQQRQWLPLDPPGAARATLGAIAACASVGPLRFGFGKPRDYVIGLKLAHADGTESRSGGKVVKNVAGYDMNKLYIGSFGTLAVITELIVKLRPLPDKSSTVLATSRDASLLTKLSASILSSNLLPSSVFLTKGISPDSAASANAQLALAVRFIESEPTVNYQVETVLKMIESGVSADVLNDGDAETFWTRAANIDETSRVVVRMSLPLSVVQSGFEKLHGEENRGFITADFATGIIRVAFDTDDGQAVEKIKTLRLESASMGGTLVVERASVGVKREADVWGDVGPTVELMKSIKAKFDPQSLLNPGMFVAGI
jgi:glycolate oxidase FAD binding subunit